MKSESHSVVSDSLWPNGLYSPWDSPGQNTGVGGLSLLQGIFPTQGSNPGLPHCRQILYQLSHQGSPRILEWVACAFSSGSSRPRDWTRVSYVAGNFFTSWAKEPLRFRFKGRERYAVGEKQLGGATTDDEESNQCCWNAKSWKRHLLSLQCLNFGAV